MTTILETLPLPVTGDLRTLIDTKASQTSLNTTNSNVAALDERVDDAEDDLVLMQTQITAINTTLSGLGDLAPLDQINTTQLVDDAVTYAKIQNVAQDKILGRATASTGNVEELSCTSFARTLLDDANAAAARATLEVDTWKKLFWSVTLPSVGDFASAPLVVFSEPGFVINILKVIAKTASGTISATPKINGSSITGIGTISMSSTTQRPTASAANQVPADGEFRIDFASDASATLIHLTIQGERD